MLTQVAGARRFGPALASLVLAACTAPGRVSDVELTSLYSSATLGTAARGGNLPTELRGQPFTAGPQPAETVVAGLRPPGWHQPFRFRTAPDPISNYSLILRFNAPPDATTGSSICQGRDPGPYGPPADRTTIHGVFCLGDRLVSEGRVSGPGVTSPADPAFRQMADALLAEIMPAYNRQVPIDSGGCGTDC